MRITAYVIVQAIAKKYQGIKGTEDIMYVFPSENFARIYLKQVIRDARIDIKLGKRSKDNLDPEKVLDFSIVPVILEIDMIKPIKKGWSFCEEDKEHLWKK